MRKTIAAVVLATLSGALWAQTEGHTMATDPAQRGPGAQSPPHSTVGPADQTGRAKQASDRVKKPGKKSGKHAGKGAHDDAAGNGTAGHVQGSSPAPGGAPTGPHGTGTTGSSPISGNNGSAGNTPN